MALSCYVYYCSGHGFGHGTRVSAFASQLLSLPETKRPVIHIVSSAPSYVFGDSIALGAQYRYADWIDPVIVQPLAYRVDRQKSVEVLKAFLKNKDRFLEIEREWLTSVKARCVLSDAAFLAAKAAGVPSILVTNFTFDSVYSYLATTFIDECSVVSSDTSLLSPDVSVAHPLLEPLVSQIHAGYCCADLLLLLPGHIPIPSFPNQPSLPATDWVNSQDNSFSPEIIQHLCCLKKTPFDCILHDHIPFPPTTVLAQKSAAACFTRKVFPMPLLVRPASSSVERSPYTPEGRAQLLNSANVPPEMHNPEMTKILVVSFGGQVLKWPGTAHSSAVGAQIQTEKRITPTSYPKIGLGIDWKNPKTPRPSQIDIPNPSASSLVMQFDDHPVELDDHRDIDPQPNISPRLATPSHIWIPGAPPVVNPTSPGVAMGVAHSPPFFERDIEKENEPQSSIVTSSRMKTDSLTTTFPPLTEIVNMHASSSVVTPGSISRCGDKSNEDSHYRENISVKTVQPQLLPDSSWIAIICGASDEQRSDTSTLPENFYLAPKDVYMPDLTVIADVLLGKLGYGTVAECIDAGTPMVYVSRPLFVEELGLRILLEKEGTGVEMSRADYEGGRWVERVKEAWEKARVAKEWKRKVEGGEMMLGANRITEREVEIRDMARVVVDWVDNCWRGI
ncbi:hypothetical protein J3R30DRAFT_3404693 [Lentinula aciculospora]|uniref:Uncharacterized protein n=1 Tax=Lentinula aciculospora TaxID=153920 RepID=A0A9W9ABV0_9AGAR|nr:hypothetical protein J3R30DRAFT_3404693 [Lentinula aciculospora]